MRNQDPVNTYIVRIYRRTGRKASNILGTMEKAGESEKKAFTTCDELWGILNPVKERGKKSNKTQSNYKRTRFTTGS